MKVFRLIQLSLLALSLMIIYSACDLFGDIITNVNLAELTTLEIVNISDTGAVGGLEVDSYGEEYIVEVGLCWSTKSKPTIDDHKLPETIHGQYYPTTFELSNLTSQESYYVRSYAITEFGKVSYGNEVDFIARNVISPCFPVNNSINYGSTPLAFTLVISGSGYGKYEEFAVKGRTGYSPQLYVEFSWPPNPGKYISVEPSSIIGPGECIIHGKFGFLADTNNFIGSFNDTVYVRKPAFDEYSIDFCDVTFTSATTSMVFTTDCNLTSTKF